MFFYHSSSCCYENMQSCKCERVCVYIRNGQEIRTKIEVQNRWHEREPGGGWVSDGVMHFKTACIGSTFLIFEYAATVYCVSQSAGLCFCLSTRQSQTMKQWLLDLATWPHHSTSLITYQFWPSKEECWTWKLKLSQLIFGGKERLSLVLSQLTLAYCLVKLIAQSCFPYRWYIIIMTTWGDLISCTTRLWMTCFLPRQCPEETASSPKTNVISLSLWGALCVCVRVCVSLSLTLSLSGSLFF